MSIKFDPGTAKKRADEYDNHAQQLHIQSEILSFNARILRAQILLETTDFTSIDRDLYNKFINTGNYLERSLRAVRGHYTPTDEENKVIEDYADVISEMKHVERNWCYGDCGLRTIKRFSSNHIEEAQDIVDAFGTFPHRYVHYPRVIELPDNYGCAGDPLDEARYIELVGDDNGASEVTPQSVIRIYIWPDPYDDEDWDEDEADLNVDVYEGTIKDYLYL